jgi:iron complex outermembrane receptor protein
MNRRFHDLAAYAPSLVANGRLGTNQATFAIRGFSQENRITATVGTYEKQGKS